MWNDPSVSYDLVFWRQTPDEARLPKNIYEALMAGDEVRDLPELPVAQYISRILEVVPGAVLDETQIHWESQDQRAACVVGWSSRSVVVNLTGDWPHSLANDFIDVGSEFGCALYDPQTDERFT